MRGFQDEWLFLTWDSGVFEDIIPFQIIKEAPRLECGSWKSRF